MLSNKRPTKARVNGDSFRTYSGAISFFADYKGKKVKAYEPYNKDQFDLRLYIDKHPISKFFPKVLGIEDGFIIEEFIIENCEVDKKQVSKFHKELLEVPYHKITWDYYDHIYNRVGLTRPEGKGKMKVNHNDITKDNILCINGQMKIIDNEMLAMNDAFGMNTFNSNILKSKPIDGMHLEKHWRIRKSWKK